MCMSRHFSHSHLYRYSSILLHSFNRDKTSTEEASKLFSRDLFTYAKEHNLLEPVLVTNEQLDAIRAGTATASTAPSVSAAAISNP